MASAADCPQRPVCGVMGDAKVHTLGLPVSAHWGGSDRRKHQGSLETRTGQCGQSACPPGPAGSVPRPRGSTCVLGLRSTAALTALWEKEDEQHDQEDEHAGAQHQPQVDPPADVLPALLLGQGLGCLAEG